MTEDQKLWNRTNKALERISEAIGLVALMIFINAAGCMQ